jgi:hypothetical protein
MIIRQPSRIASAVHTLDGPAGAHTDDLFIVHGPCQIVALSGVVDVILADGLTVPQLVLHAGAVDAVLSTDAGVLSLLPPGSWVSKVGDVGDGLAIVSSAAHAVLEPAQDVLCRPWLAVPDAQLPTTIRLNYTSAGAAAGTILWRVEYVPLGRGGITPA